MTTAPPADERRADPRYPVELRARVTLHGKPLEIVTRDISKGGICLWCSTAVTRGTWLRLSLSLALGHNALSEHLDVPGKVVWCTRLDQPAGYQIGIKFGELDQQMIRYLEIFLRLLHGDLIIDVSS